MTKRSNYENRHARRNLLREEVANRSQQAMSNVLTDDLATCNTDLTEAMTLLTDISNDAGFGGLDAAIQARVTAILA